jgi:hypothetical protein
MLLLYAGDTKPGQASIVLNPEEKSAELKRSADESIILEDIPDDIFDSLTDADTLLVCEIKDTDDDQENELVYAYEAEIED